jgi:hypothetical protein
VSVKNISFVPNNGPTGNRKQGADVVGGWDAPGGGADKDAPDAWVFLYCLHPEKRVL